MKKNISVEICIALIVLLFSYTAMSKLLDYPKFVFQMSLAPVPMIKTFAPLIGLVLPVLEALIAVALLTERFRLKAIYLTTVLLLFFEAYISTMLLSGLRLPCTCGGIISRMSWTQHLVFNGLFIGLSIFAILQIKRNKREAPLSAPPPFKDLSRA